MGGVVETVGFEDSVLKTLNVKYKALVAVVFSGMIAAAGYGGKHYAESYVMGPPNLLGPEFARNIAGIPGAIFAGSVVLHLCVGYLLSALRFSIDKCSLTPVIAQVFPEDPLIGRDDTPSTPVFQMRDRQTLFQRAVPVFSGLRSFVLHQAVLPAVVPLILITLANAEFMNFFQPQQDKNKDTIITAIVLSIVLGLPLSYETYKAQLKCGIRPTRVEIRDEQGHSEQNAAVISQTV